MIGGTVYFGGSTLAVPGAGVSSLAPCLIHRVEHRDLLRLERVGVLGHVRLGAGDHLDQLALVGSPGDDRVPVLAALDQVGVRRHVQLALDLLGLVAGVAVGREDRADVVVEADGFVRPPRLRADVHEGE